MNDPLVRSLEFETGIAHQACKGVADPSRLLEHAQHRAHALSGEYVRDPMLILRGRNRRRDAREEYADAFNHLAFDSLENIEDEARTAENLIVIRFTTLAYNRLLMAEED